MFCVFEKNSLPLPAGLLLTMPLSLVENSALMFAFVIFGLITQPILSTVLLATMDDTLLRSFEGMRWVREVTERLGSGGRVERAWERPRVVERLASGRRDEPV